MTLTKAETGRLGGLVRSPAKRRALRALHRKRRGRRANDPGIPAGELQTLLAQVRDSVAHAEWGRSKRALAEHVGVADRTIRRWLGGTDWPPARHVKALQAWVHTKLKLPLD